MRKKQRLESFVKVEPLIVDYDKPNSLNQFFPFEQARPEQEQAWDFITENAKNKNVITLELPTGVGKSPLAISAAKGWSKIDQASTSENLQSGTYILTTQKILQQQYVNDFQSKGDVNSVWSKQSYQCECHPGLSCHVGKAYARYHADTEIGKHCLGRCPYTRDLKTFLEGRISVTNTPFFLNQATYNSDMIKKRELLIVDEAHNLEDALVSFIGIDINKKFLREIELEWPSFKVKAGGIVNLSQVVMWVDKTYEPYLKNHLNKLENQAQQAAGKKDTKKAIKLVKRWTKLDSTLCSIHRFQDGFEIDNWVVNVLPDRYELRPIEIDRWGRSSLFSFARKAMLMSATILDPIVYARSLGLDPKEVGYYSQPSPFGVDQRPVYYAPVGSLSMKKIDDTLPALARRVQEIVDHYQEFKGIIHCHSYKIMDYLVRNLSCKDKKGRNRILHHTSDNRSDVYQEHLESSHPTVLLSPSMSEGVDLKDDLSRFQVICKVPFPYLGDKRIKIKFDRDKQWYNCLTARTMMQQTGRSIRGANDWAHSFILDADFEGFVKRSGTMFPQWWLEAIQIVQA